MRASRNVEINSEIPGLTKTAYMDMAQLPRDASRVHDDESARGRGLRGALVGGSILISYLLEMLYRYFGLEWMKHGMIDISFIGGGAINGDKLTGRAMVVSKQEEDEGVRVFLNVWLENQFGDKIAVGKASCRVT